MKRFFSTSLVWLAMLSIGCAADDYSMPSKDWPFMRGYKYEYPDCSVFWHEGKASFFTAGNGCEKISSEKMRSDAIKSIAYVRKNSSAKSFEEYYGLAKKVEHNYTLQQANQAAVQIWNYGCSDYKKGLNSGNFSEWLKLGETVKSYSQIKSIAVNRLYMDGWNVALGLGGVVNCQEMAPYRAADYVSGVDIRKAE